MYNNQPIITLIQQARRCFIMSERIYVWDPLVRLFHWSLVFSFIVAYVTGEDGEDPAHVYSSYIIMGLIVFRIIWGLIGSKHARFGDFVTSPVTALSHGKDMLAGKAKHYLGHNPLGGWMILALLLSLGITTVTGLKLYGVEGHGPLAQQQTSMSQQAVNNGLVMLVNGREHDDRVQHQGKSEPGEGHDYRLQAKIAYLQNRGTLVSCHGWRLFTCSKQKITINYI
jgi:cytochrome b